MPEEFFTVSETASFPHGHKIVARPSWQAETAGQGSAYFTVRELNQFIKDVINAGFPQTLWVCGEIQQYDRNKHKDHVFFELVEKDSNSKDIVARIGLVIFANRKFSIENILKQSENAFPLKDDIEVKFLCKIDFYAPHGALRLIVESIDPVYTLGKLAQAKQKLIASLKEKGIFEKNKQQTLPLAPLNIGLITAFDSAAYNDFLSELQKSGFGFKIFLRDTLVQGKRAEKDVVRALKELQKMDGLDLIVITRGGGSLADLSCFDSARIAEAIAKSQLPILSGIGHEINLTITDLAAHTYAKTPTAIAQFLVERVKIFLKDLDTQESILCETVFRKIENKKASLRVLASGLQEGLANFLKDHQEQIIRLREWFRERPFIILKDQNKLLLGREELLRKTVNGRLNQDQLKLKHYQKFIDIANPINTMKRGFSITRNRQGKVLKRIEDVNSLEEIQTQLTDGSLISQVIDAQNSKEKKGWPKSNTVSLLND